MALNFYRSDGWVKLVSGQAVSGAQVYVLNQPANVTPPMTPPRTLPVPFTPNPQVQVYSDAGFTTLAQPVITDGFGHYDFYVLPGLYTVAIFFGGKLQQFYIDQSIGNVGSTLGTTLLLEVNGSPLFNQMLFNLQQGPNVILTPDNFGNVTISATAPAPPPSLVLKTNGIANGSQALLNLKNGTAITIVDDGVGGVTINSSPGITLKTNGILNGSQTLLNLANGDNVTIVQDGSGNVTIASDTIPQPDKASFVLWQAFSSDPTHHLAILDALTIGSTSTGRIYYGNRTFAFPGRRTVCKGTVNYDQNANTAAGDYIVGFSNSLGSGTVDPRTLDSCCIGVHKVANISPGNWFLFTSLAGVVTSVDSGVPIVTAQRYQFEIILDNGVATLFINGVSVCSSNTHLPVANCDLVWWLNNNAGGGGGTTDSDLPANASRGASHAVSISDGVASLVKGTFEYNYLENATP